MNLDDISDRLQLINDLLGHVDSILDSMEDDTYINKNDWCLLRRLQEKLWALGSLLFTENKFDVALYEIEKMKNSEEDSKWSFPLEKSFNLFIKEDLFKEIKILIDCSRSWSFEDYRARNFQDELRQKMTMLRDWYKDKYDSENDDE